MVKEHIANITKLETVFFFFRRFGEKNPDIYFYVFGSLLTSLLCIVGLLAGGGSVAVCFSDT